MLAFRRCIATGTTLLLLGGCAVLNSEAPLIARSDPAAGIAPGSYQLYAAFEPGDAARLRPAERSLCLDAGYSRRQTDALGWPTGRPLRLLYCPFDTDERESIPPLRLDAVGGDFRIAEPEPSKGDREHGMDDATIRFERLSDSLLLLQLAETGRGVGARDAGDRGHGTFYSLIRRSGIDYELHMVPCDNGMRIVSNEVAGSGRARHSARKREREPAPPPKLKCEVTTLDAIRPDLFGYAADPNAAPVAIVRRVGD